jgi:ppGpp synthetase/RelA/SpoT-type nucleotidyltranferase
MTETEILRQWEADGPIYQAWAEFVKCTICSALTASLSPLSLTHFLKVPVEPRLKDPKSFIDKALYRNKNYEDPYADVTDKAGIRFVVLLTSDIRKVEQAICESDRWSASKDRDYEEEREAKPLEFTYQSVHYVVRASDTLKSGEVEIPAGTPCEVQVRTLLQHAHCELSHDSIYKSKKTAPPRIRRAVARSIALIEAADDFFETAMDELKKGTAQEREAIELLGQIYRDVLKREPEVQESNFLIMDAYPERLGAELAETLRAFLQTKPYILERIAERAETQHLYRQPVILLIYLLAAQSPAVTKDRWPLTAEELRPLYRDLGLSIDDH